MLGQRSVLLTAIDTDCGMIYQLELNVQYCWKLPVDNFSTYSNLPLMCKVTEYIKTAQYVLSIVSESQ